MELPFGLWSKDVVLALVFMLLTPLLYNLWSFLHMVWLTPRRIMHIFALQGVRCMPYHLFHGSLPEFVAILKEVHSRPMPKVSHDIIPHALPAFHQWSQKYGKFVFWEGCEARFFITDPEDVKEVLMKKFTQCVRGPGRPDMVNLLGDGLLLLEGERWAFHRRILHPGFLLEKLKAMVPTIARCTIDMIEKWNFQTGMSLEVDVSVELRDLTLDIIALTAFGSNYEEGKQIVVLQQEQLRLAQRIAHSIYIPGARLLPTSFNRHCRKVEKSLEEVILRLVEKRVELSKAAAGRGEYKHGNDLLGLMVDAMKNESQQGNGKGMTMGIADIVGECKTFFLAGHDSTATFLSWTFLLLAEHPEWQEHVREEVQAVYGASALPTANLLHCLKILGMVLNESLRLYPPAPVTMRTTTADMQLGKLTIPQHTTLMLALIALHHDERYWGPDAKEFHPERFKDGVANAWRVPGTFMPFLTGPHVCIGQAFSILEAKIVIATVLQRYRIRVSPAYKHSPVSFVTLQPQYGIPLLIEKI